MGRTCKGISWLFGLAILTGCWDRVEIEERGFVIGTAIDAAANNQFVLTFQYAVPSAFTGGSDMDGKKGEAFLNVMEQGRTLFRAARKMSNESSRSPYLEHNKIILVSERLAKEGKLEEVLDLFLRDHEMRRAAKVMIAEGEARKLLELKPRIEKLPVLYINATAENPKKSESITPPTKIGEVHRFLLEEYSYALPKISAEGTKIKVSGAAVFNGYDNRLRGFLSADLTSGRNFFRGTVKTATVEIVVENQLVAFELKSASRKMKASVSDPEHPVFDIHVAVSGNVGESYTQADLLKPKIMADIEAKVSAKIAEAMDDVLNKAQKEYRSDILGLGEHLNENHHRAWMKIHDNWDHGENLFSRARVNIHVKTKLRIIGSIENSQPKR
ncbi:Ger(x)C family spore germination protein [Cohnella cholangitidis]|uniref:Ger(X)C family spore germination protein n=1 Tax=Cohnella cholangitidis TaxID=2598458 RepID=A0A7G5BY44_9BACL|nr:Ger(x)C family spore germination protein [Cohnella cholangitidis]QMV41878.1 Ger(x)C family spore germination protein [Cohnella cholangitidis]